MKKILPLLLISLSLMANPTVNTTLPHVVLDKDNGSYVKGGAWDSSMLQGKTTLLMYVDPDEKSKGEVFKPTIEAFEKELDFSKFQILVIINLNATWKPNALIEKLLQNKMEDYPQRIYVMDKESVLVKKWKMNDDEYNVLVVNPQAKVLFSHSGEWKKEDMNKVDKLVRKTVAE